MKKFLFILWLILLIIVGAVASIVAPLLVSAPDWLQVITGVLLVVFVVSGWITWFYVGIRWAIKHYGVSNV